MKLYTEEQVRLLLDLAKLKINGEGYSKETLLENVAPIELPSDEEIDDKSNTIDIEGLSWEVRLARDFFNDGAKWVMEQIKQQGIGH